MLRASLVRMGICSAKPKPKSARTDLVLGKYELISGKPGALGEGSFSIVQKAKDINTGKEVAVKYYKRAGTGKAATDSTLKRFDRQVAVLLRLAKPLVQPKNEPTLWTSKLDGVQAKQSFLELFDYTRQSGSLDLTLHTLYLATEIGDYSLKDLIADYREKNLTFSIEQTHSVAKGVLMVGAVLHAKQLVHLDIKPENFMYAGDAWKLIDVDGCVQRHSNVGIHDSSISFSPLYCAPEWATFLINSPPSILISEKLDVWSIAISLCELVTLCPVFKSQYAFIFRQIGDYRKSGFGFLEWLADNDSWKSVLPPTLSKTSEKSSSGEFQYRDLLQRLLKTNPAKRETMAQILSHEFIENTTSEKVSPDFFQIKSRQERAREPVSQRPPRLKGMVYKLNSDSDMKDAENWLKRDMWLSHNGSLCYFSAKHQKRLVYLNANVIIRAEVSRITEPCAMPFAFKLVLASSDDGEYETAFLACETEEQLELWMKHLRECSDFQYKEVKTIQFSAGLMADFRKFKLQVRNRRENLDKDPSFLPSHDDELYKLNQDGDPTEADHWTLRRMWLAKNGSLCYESKKETKNLQYFTAADMKKITVSPLQNGTTCHEFAFQLQLPPVDGLEYAPAHFAATSCAAMDAWIKAIKDVRDKEANEVR